VPTKVLVPTDFSEYSDKALRLAFDIAIQYKARVYMVHVLHGKNPHDTGDGTIPSYYEDSKKQMIGGARKKLQEEIDLIMIASLGQSGISKYLIGSVARNVLKEARRPALCF
jgi:universal stress protein A